jgi:hypothetical protein
MARSERMVLSRNLARSERSGLSQSLARSVSLVPSLDVANDNNLDDPLRSSASHAQQRLHETTLCLMFGNHYTPGDVDTDVDTVSHVRQPLHSWRRRHGQEAGLMFSYHY